MNRLLVVLGTFALAGCVSISPPISTSAAYACGITASWGSWAGLAALGALLSFFILVLVYMGATVLGIAGAATWAKNEFYQTAASLVIVANLVLAVGVLCSPSFPALFGLDPKLIGMPAGTTPNLYDYAFEYVRWLNEKIIIGWLHAFVLQWRTAIATSYASGMQPGGYGVSVQPMAGLSALESGLNLMLQSFTIAWITNLVQAEILKFILVSMFNIVLPVGVVLRCFSFTRAFGGALMGIAVALFVFYPILLGINMLAIADATNAVVDALSSQYRCTPGSTTECCGGLTCNADGSCPPCIFAGEADNPSKCCSGKFDPNQPGRCLELGYPGDACSADSGCFSGKCEGGVCTTCKVSQSAWSVSGEDALGMLTIIGNVIWVGLVAYFAPVLTSMMAIGRLGGMALLKGALGGTLLALLGGTYAIFGLIRVASYILIGAILLPAFNFILLVTIARDLSRFFGEEVDVSNLTRMI
ncbi:MAG: hypothetical protein QXG98_00455 [Candidatus Micrarchaeia archaeon]